MQAGKLACRQADREAMEKVCFHKEKKNETVLGKWDRPKHAGHQPALCQPESIG